jgi:hypothetical protein
MKPQRIGKIEITRVAEISERLRFRFQGDA